MVRSSRAAASIIFLVVLASCAAPPGGPPVSQSAPVGQSADGITGTYQLVAVNGVRVPGAIRHDGIRLYVESGIFRIDANGSVFSETVFSPPEGGRLKRQVSATYSRSGTDLVMRWEGAGVTRGKVDGDIFVMNNHGMRLVYSLSGAVDPSLDLARLGQCEPVGEDVEPMLPAAGVFDDFEGDLILSADCYGNLINFFTFQDSPDTRIEISTVSDHPRRAGEAESNRVLRIDLEVRAWAGVIHNFENATADSWTPRDWSGFDAIGFWIHGDNSGTQLFLDILENRKPGSSYDDAERFTHTFVDNFDGWKKITVPFRQMLRKHIGNQAPDDGFDLHQVHGWAFGTTHTDGPLTLYLDGIELIKLAPGAAVSSREPMPVDYPINELPM